MTPQRLVAELAARTSSLPDSRPARVLFDGAPGTGIDDLADAVAAELRTLGRPPLRVRADQFWRDASLRLEWGQHDEQSYYEAWLDADALRREVLDPLGPDGNGIWLPSLRDPITNRSTRAAREPAGEGSILIVSGALLLVHALPADLIVHCALSAPALARRTPESDAWTLPAFARYEREAQPSKRADVVVRLEDPRHPAMRP